LAQKLFQFRVALLWCFGVVIAKFLRPAARYAYTHAPLPLLRGKYCRILFGKFVAANAMCFSAIDCLRRIPAQYILNVRHWLYMGFTDTTVIAAKMIGH